MLKLSEALINHRQNDLQNWGGSRCTCSMCMAARTLAIRMYEAIDKALAELHEYGPARQILLDARTAADREAQ